jgi:hypothetical protein
MMVENYYKGQNILNNSPYNGEQGAQPGVAGLQPSADLATACHQHTRADGLPRTGRMPKR